MKRSLVDLGQQLLDAAKRAGADACDALVVDGVSHSIEVRGGQLEQAERAEGIDIGLRVMLGARQACVSASDISVEAIELMAQRAVEMARHAPDDAYLCQASAEQLARDWDVEALELSDPAKEPSAAQLQATALEAEAANTAADAVSSSGLAALPPHLGSRRAQHGQKRRDGRRQ